MDYSTINGLLYLVVFIMLVWIILIIVKGRASGELYWKNAATILGMQLKHRRASIYIKNQPFPFAIDDLGQFLPVLSDPAHILMPVNELSGVYEGNKVSLVEATGGFRWRMSLLPAQTSVFYFFGHSTIGSSQSPILITPHNPRFGDKVLKPIKNMEVVASSPTYSAYSMMNDDRRPSMLLSLLETREGDPNFYVVVVNNSLYLYSTYRPDLVRWTKLLNRMAQAMDTPQL